MPHLYRDIFAEVFRKGPTIEKIQSHLKFLIPLEKCNLAW